LGLLSSAKVRFDQCLQGFAACFAVEVNITGIVQENAETGLNAWVLMMLLQ
jgi:hypothetical protein